MVNSVTAWQNIHRELSGSVQGFRQKLIDVEAVQQQQLLQILNRNAASPLGKKYQFSKIQSYTDFAQAIPIQTYEDYRPYIEELAENKSSAHGQDILCFEQTGGTTLGAKLIPYTSHTFQSFQEALFPWLDDLLLSRPAIKAGSAYWSISPVVRVNRVTASGYAIGLANDALYFGENLAYEISQTLAVAADVANAINVDTWRYQTLRDLLLAEDLSFISVWSPTFLLELLQHLPEMTDWLMAELKIKVPERVDSILTAIQCDPVNTSILWPALDSISCWKDGAAARFIDELQHLFPHVHIQGKGLLATEGVVTIPLSNAKAPVLAVSSGFFEFIDESGQVKLAHEMIQGQDYRVVLSNDSGLYRYDLGDKVRMQGWYFHAPMLTFIGRGQQSSDLCGEKLTDDFVAEVLANLNGFCVLYPQLQPYPHYVLMSDINEVCLQQLDEALCHNPQYRYARKIGQLKPPRHIVNPVIRQCYSNWQLHRGQNLGDIKPASLITDEQLIRAFHESL